MSGKDSGEPSPTPKPQLHAWTSPQLSKDSRLQATLEDNHVRYDVVTAHAHVHVMAVESSPSKQHAPSTQHAPYAQHTDGDRSCAPSRSGVSKSMVSTTSTSTMFGISESDLTCMNSEKNMEVLSSYGGIDGLSDMLQSDLDRGIEPRAVANGGSVEGRQRAFGKNELPTAQQASFFAIMWGNLQDPILILLMAAAAVSTALGAGLPEQRAKKEWIEGVAIWAAVLIVSGVGAANDYQKDKQFRKLNEQRDIIEIKVIRAAKRMLVTNKEIVVGDIILLDAGDKVVADCLAYDCQGLMIDEAALTGESDAIKKNGETDPWVRAGTQVSEGSAKALVVAVGESSEWGRTMALMDEAGDDQTPLQKKLEVVAMTVGKFGFAVAIACFLALLIGWIVRNKGFPIKEINNNGPVQFFLYAITIIVVAIPEGLPLAVTISLAFSMKKMLMDQNFVRVLSACETMGGATAICSDKTGTLTENRMTVVEGWFAGRFCDHVPPPSELQPEVLEALTLNMAINSKAFLLDKQDANGTVHGRVGFVGSPTECAMLMLLRSWGIEYTHVREKYQRLLKKLHGFTSTRKMSSAVIKHEDCFRLYNKGAAEWVLQRCTHVMNGGDKIPSTPEIMEKLTSTVTLMAKRGLRCICLTYTDFELEDFERPFDFFDSPEDINQNLCVLAIVGIKDPVRPEVPEAVATCQRAGICVRMVTGDNIHTAMHIARDCGILTNDEHTAMEGPNFRKMHAEDLRGLQDLLPNLRVLARSSPEDKLTLVKLLKSQGEVVAVTGDGTNDAPALKESDVGLAMGIAGTEVAKEAADIIILDDNFSSIVKSVLWGRSVFNNIRKFLQFQLTVNTAALVICFVGAVAGGIEPLNVLQLLWVNLIMDTMGALALATEDPSPTLLKQKPNGADESLINYKMWKHIIIQALYQVLIQLLVLFVLPILFTRFKSLDQLAYYRDNCRSSVTEHLALQSGTVPDAAWYCDTMINCGFPLQPALINSNLCPLYVSPTPTSTVDVDAICLNNATTAGTPCERFTLFDSARSNLQKSLDEENATILEEVLSVLFNAFICCQIFNEICSRRINDEYDFFSGLHKSPVFMSVIFITIGLQAIIMQFMGIFFKVVPLDWVEWLCCIAAGFGSCLVSWATRWISRNSSWDAAQLLVTARGTRRMARTLSGRPITNGRTFSGRLEGSPTMNKFGGNSVAVTRGHSLAGPRAQSHSPSKSGLNKVAPSNR